MRCSRAVYYALDVNPRNLFELFQSVRSIRRHAPELEIFAVISGDIEERHQAALDALIVSRLKDGISPTFLKWHALTQLPECRELLYLDTDTLVLDDPMRVLDLSGDEDFHARLEIGCEADLSIFPYLINVKLIIKSNLDCAVFKQIADCLSISVLPIFNTGVMLFRNDSVRKIAPYWNRFLRLERGFRRKQIPYPCQNAHILEQVVAALVLGGIEGFTWTPLDRELCPFYLEYKGLDAISRGVVLHTWRQFYSACIFEFVGREEALTHEALRSAKPFDNISTMLAGYALLLGSAWIRLPEAVLRLWVRAGADILKTNRISSHSV